MAAIVTPFEVMECNTAMAAAGINAKLHLTDSCGGQSFWYEGEPGEIKKAAEFSVAFFKKRGNPHLFD